jgi:hypothetical protein
MRSLALVLKATFHGSRGNFSSIPTHSLIGTTDESVSNRT